MLALSCHGDNTKPALVMLHGFLGDKSDWSDLLRELTQYFYCVCIDLPGHGKSETMTLETSGFVQVANAIQLSLSQLNISKYHLLGYSLGGRIAMHIAKLHYENLLSLNLESAHPGLINNNDKASRLKNDKQWSYKLSTQTIESFLVDWYQQGVFAELSTSAIDNLVEKRRDNHPQSLQSIYLPTSLAQQENLWQLPNQVEFVCHYYVGDKDCKFADLAKRWQNVSSIKVHTIKNAGHNVHLAAPASFCQQLVYQLIGNHK
ncbi:2-succinyl-6-hydroxy-2,4-cyclohexadiene-1-carboxylate synthase [Shewanella eurypsychrophilus]|uniref:Putative 2-succinyl-6-hydroxy-2,4-cyclohexadiene-1-carboxylate synthase n=1 Tax=Shewanella eurypsychrophilus TaxID=2593656 RepID=A0ABX6V1E9_9GAMM|nr:MULTISPECIES: 2-succinyl-6-hydroxy-2,4-cyclohexadiene-1-carboxylate synthase [Shewanella]QFU20635.1 2-succinyl-6-hydroxy-2,4-cyclohexadiene-1-carboxylate synthase [Shewanella sp. YLB-09]QFU20915.1 2-succinyl-6-hydroxy-2,4-cyclohexadiene-1-carboxylate synthase [Shewanella sp. YLB-09]QPG56203.1 2-succinyl-6-hydroxy-2,4-cyclohexadiene-1-carboxylate synthase [Shewanella eurypsychrophilus]